MLQPDTQRSEDRGRAVQLRLIYADTWSLTKLAALISFVIAAVCLVLTVIGWNTVLELHVLAPVDKILHDVTGDRSYSLESALSMPTVLRFVVPVSALTFIVGTVLGPVCAILYNLAVGVAGGLTIRLDTPR
ncbi:DUF3566 domain-containing protein [Curtobacterium sp. L1-20]|uniref:DUF3566 domain-containing protein n=1 Tax=Curtobacterium sp. L1-20 TaxID=3138181 RepID=UPI003B5171AA